MRNGRFPGRSKIRCILAAVLTCALLAASDAAEPELSQEVGEPHLQPPARAPHEHEHPPPASAPAAVPWHEWPHMTGDWGGARRWLAEHGVTLEVAYSADFFYNTCGGLNTSGADQYRGLLDLSVTLDTQAMGLWDDGTVFLDFQQIHGTDITQRHLGDLQVVNNADAPNRSQLAEFWYMHSLLEGKLRVKLGKMDANADFAYVDYGAEHVHSSAGFQPIIPLPSYPDPAIGGVLLVEPADWLYLRGGIYDADGRGNRTGFDTVFHGRDDSLTIAEIGLQPAFRAGGHELPGRYAVGGWYHSGSRDVFFNDLDGRRPPRFHRGNAGVYVNIDQLIYRENPDIDADEQGLGAFMQFAWAPSSYNEICQYYGFGCSYTGLLPGRDADITGFGVYHASLSGEIQSLERRHAETAIELFHEFRLTPFFSLKPDVQFIADPGGAGRDALVAGVRMEIIF